MHMTETTFQLGHISLYNLEFSQINLLLDMVNNAALLLIQAPTYPTDNHSDSTQYP